MLMPVALTLANPSNMAKAQEPSPSQSASPVVKGEAATSNEDSDKSIDPALVKKTISVEPVLATKAVIEKSYKALKTQELSQATEALDSTLIDQLNQCRKFEVVARNSDLTSIIKEQMFGASEFVDPKTAAKARQLAGAQYLIVTTIIDFVMGTQTSTFQGIGVTVNKEAVRISCNLQIYNTTTGKLIESARFRGQDTVASAEGSAWANGASLTKITDRMAAEFLGKIVDVIYPAKVVAKSGTQITINRGEGAGVEVGQEWMVFALGEEVVDSDTGEKLGRNESPIGTIKIVRTTPKLSYGVAIQDFGITKGHLLRLKQSQTKSQRLNQTSP